MRNPFTPLLVVLVSLLASCAFAQTGETASNGASSPYHDPSPHRVEMVQVENGVQLEVLDWGGEGRAVVLLAGSGNTAHIYDNFAPLLAQYFHVYGITRRGYGASSAPATGYSVDRLGEDIVNVIEALKLSKPVLVGHSFAGQEVSWVATKFPGKIGGAVYLDAAYSYAFYDPKIGDLAFDLTDLQKSLEQFDSARWDVKRIDELLRQLSSFESELERQKKHLELAQRVAPGQSTRTAADLASFTSLGEWYSRNMVGGTPPESELRQSFNVNPDGSVGKPLPHPTISQEDSKWERFTSIPVPVLAIFACPVDYGPAVDDNSDLREGFDAINTADCQVRAKAIQKDIPSARVLLWPHVYHYLFIAKQDETLQELRSFISSLPQDSRGGSLPPPNM